MVSLLVHGLAVLVAVAIIHTPKIREAPVARRYTTLTVQLHSDGQKLQWSPKRGGAQPSPQADSHAGSSSEELSASAAPQSRTPAPMTLIQPEIAPNALLQLETPIPLVALWTPPTTPITTIIPPPPQPQTAPSVHPSLAMPNRELKVAAIELSSMTASSETIPMLAGTTIPIPAHGLDPSQVPQSSSHTLAQPTPRAMLSVSDVVLPEGTITLPPANQTAAAFPSDTFAAGVFKGTSPKGDGTGVRSTNEGAAPGASVEHGSQNQAATGSDHGGGPSAGPGSGVDTGSDSASSSDNRSSLDRIIRPKDGHFGVVVVGDSVAEEYPEAAGILADRLAYTVYLHVGQTKSWILQYCLPRSAQAAGNTVRPDAPWPYLMVTPHLSPDDYDADALLIHGFINALGQFEKLAVVFPAQFTQSKFVLTALQQWQFRPASQNGQSTVVEVLLIIPQDAN
jgi:hypothetical protein